jgi:UDP:flavonoid glycosyltransferase YjiC (YdhE family)
MASGKRTVYISACGIGLGHIGRVAAVADILRQEGVDCVFSTYGPAYKYITSAGYKAYESPMLMWDEYGDGSIAVPSSVAKIPFYLRTFAIHMEHERRRLSHVKPDAILVDSRYSTTFATGHGDAPHFFLSNQIKFQMPGWKEKYLMRWASGRISRANYHWTRRAKEVFVPDLPPPDSIAKDNLSVPGYVMKRLNFVGPICRAAPENYTSKEETAKSLGFKDGLFVYAAVSGPGKTRNLLIDTLKRTLPDFPGASVIVKGSLSDSTIESIGGNVTVHGWTDKRYEHLKACSIVVSRPGFSTVSEIARFGKPAILVPIPTQTEQEGIAEGMAAHGSAKVIQQREFNPTNLKNALEDIVARRGEFERNAARLMELAAKHDGARNVADRMLEYLRR